MESDLVNPSILPFLNGRKGHRTEEEGSSPVRIVDAPAASLRANTPRAKIAACPSSYRDTFRLHALKTQALPKFAVYAADTLPRMQPARLGNIPSTHLWPKVARFVHCPNRPQDLGLFLARLRYPTFHHFSIEVGYRTPINDWAAGWNHARISSARRIFRSSTASVFHEITG